MAWVRLPPKRVIPGSFGENSARIDRFLQFHGYGQLEESRKALKQFQARHGSPATGNLNYQTCRLLNARRCCHPECEVTNRSARQRFRQSTFRPIRAAIEVAGPVPPEVHIDTSLIGQNHPYEQVPARWTRRSLRFALLGAPPHSLGEMAWDAIRRAFRTWSERSIVAFTEVQDGALAEIRVLWTPGPSDDPSSSDPFYGPGGYAALSYYPYAFLGELAGDLHFDLKENWTLAGDLDHLDVETVALHEIGHCLGIGHCREQASAMFPAYKQVQRTPTQGDVAEVERIYAQIPA